MLQRVVRERHDHVVLDTIQHPLLTDRVVGRTAQLANTDLAGGGRAAELAAPAGDQLLQVLSGSFAVAADEDRAKL